MVSIHTYIHTQGISQNFSLFISIETTTDTESTITSLDRASFHPKDTIFSHNHYYWLDILAFFLIFKKLLTS